MDLSIIVPIYNEEESIELLHKELKKVLSQTFYSYEIIYVDDGSLDKSYEILINLYEIEDIVRVIKFRKNFGQTAALSAGFDYALGKTIVTLDADLQNDPQDIPRLLNKMEEGYDIVSGWRKDRKDKFITRRIPSIIANKIISKVTGVHLHDYGCTLKAYNGKVLRSINLYGELHRFIPAVASLVGVKVTEIVVKHHPRLYGQSKYGLNRTFRVILDLITIKFLLKYLAKPMQFFGKFGLWALFSSFVLFIITIYMKIAMSFDITGNPFFMVACIALLGGIQIILTGIIAEMVSRTYYEGQSKSIYSIDQIHSQEERKAEKTI